MLYADALAKSKQLFGPSGYATGSDPQPGDQSEYAEFNRCEFGVRSSDALGNPTGYTMYGQGRTYDDAFKDALGKPWVVEIVEARKREGVTA